MLPDKSPQLPEKSLKVRPGVARKMMRSHRAKALNPAILFWDLSAFFMLASVLTSDNQPGK